MGNKETRKETDFWGNEKEVHYEDGKKVGETKYRETFWGNKIQDHYDSSGNKTGETRREEGVFSDKAVHYDADGNRTGYTKNDETFFGDPTHRHYDKFGNQVGKSHYEEGFWGEHKKVHTGEYFKSGESKNETFNYNGRGYSGSEVPSGSRRTEASGNKFPNFPIGILIVLILAFVSWLAMFSSKSEKIPVSEKKNENDRNSERSEADKRHDTYVKIKTNQQAGVHTSKIKADTFSYSGKLLETDISDGSAGFVWFSQSVKNKVIAGMCSGQSEVYIIINGKNYDYYSGSMELNNNIGAAVTFYYRNKDKDHFNRCITTGCDNFPCPIGVVVNAK